jgi:hypothetical protein
MTNLDKINQLINNLALNSRMPLNPIIHKLAYDDKAIQLLSSELEVRNHIAFIVIKPEQADLLRISFFRSFHCIIVKGYGVILSSNCSLITESILENLALWSPYLKVNVDEQYYGIKNPKL